MNKLLLPVIGAAAFLGLALPASAQNINAQTGSTYTFANTDCSKLVTFTNASATVAATLPQPSSPTGGGSAAGTFMPPCSIGVSNLGSLPVTITPTSSTIDGGSSLVVPVGGGVTLINDGTNWHKYNYGLASASIGPNLIQNGDFQFDQRNAGASQTITSGTPAMTVDRWYATFTTSTSSAGNPTTQQVSIGTGSTITAKELKFTANATASTTTPAALISTLQQSIEGTDLADLQWGTAGALPVTYSFWLKTSSAGTWGVALQNAAAAQSYVTNCTTAAATWTYCTATIPGDTSGTWNNTPNSIGGVFLVTQDCGSTFQATAANAWASGAYSCTSAQTQLTAVASATMEMTAVKLERGTVPTVFVSDPAPVALAKLQRFFKSDFLIGTAPAQNVGTGKGETCFSNPIANGEGSVVVNFQPPMYHVASPTITLYSPGNASANFYDVTGTAAVTAGAAVGSDSTLYIPTGATVTTIAHQVCVHWAYDTKL